MESPFTTAATYVFGDFAGLVINIAAWIAAVTCPSHAVKLTRSSTVSYTHLDVYKRQKPGRFRSRSWKP